MSMPTLGTDSLRLIPNLLLDDASRLRLAVEGERLYPTLNDVPHTQLVKFGFSSAQSLFADKHKT